MTSSKYDSEFLRKTIKEKDDEIETLRHKLTEYEQHIQQIKENEKQAQDNALNLEEVNQQLQDKLTERDKFIDELHLGNFDLRILIAVSLFNVPLHALCTSVGVV